MSGPAISVVVPTYNRLALLCRTLPRLLGQARRDGGVEIVVVVDGSSDGTLEWLAGLERDPMLQVVSQENRGLAAARNRGVEVACSGTILFLDDDMILDDEALKEHQAAHAGAGERVLFGALALAPGVRRSFLKLGVEIWGEQVRERLSAPGYRLRFDDCHFGHASVTRRLLLASGGFDETFVTFGNEDYELGWRLIQAGAEMRFLASAVARQIYDKDMRRWLRDCECVGQADRALAAKHPSLTAQLRMAAIPAHPLRKLARRSGLSTRDPLAPAWGILEAGLFGLEVLGARGEWLGKAQSLAGERRYWKGIRASQSSRPGGATGAEVPRRSVA